ncbi:MAG TPA: hypothetical protein DCM67_08290 [Propionibacteriaceae bacterium]|nr:hypothetical protein [Propionibacteriaceae bacterium]
MATQITNQALQAGTVPRVNLLPPAEMERRSRRELIVRWFGAAFVAVVLVFSVSAVAFGWAAQASGYLIQQQEAAASLNSQMEQYRDVAHLSSDAAKLRQMRAVAGANDIDWTALADEIKAVLPTKVTLTGFRLAPGAAPKAGADAKAQVGLQGTLTFSSNRTVAQAETINKLRTLPGLLSVDAGALSVADNGGYTFEATVSFDQTRYTGRFDETGGK